MAGEETRSGHEGTGSSHRVKGWFGRPPSTEVPPSIRESAAEVLARTTLPDRQVTLNDVSIYEVLPIDFTATRRLAGAVNKIKETPINRFELDQLKPPPAVYGAIPWVASAIVHHYNPDIPVILPNEQDIVALRPWLRDVSNFLGRFSARWQYKFGRFIERKAEDALEEVARNVLKRVDLIGQIDRPKARFIPELTQLYEGVTEPEYVDDGSFDLEEALDSLFGGESAPRKVKVSIEKKVASLVVNLRYARDGSPNGWINRYSYPLVSRVVEMTKFPPDSVDEGEAGIIGSEILSGVETFLKGEGVRGISAAPRPVNTFDIFDANTWSGDSVMRSLAETFKPETVVAVKRGLPSILVEVQNLLPESGPGVVDAVRILSENILILSKQGVSNAEIAVALFRKSQG